MSSLGLLIILALGVGVAFGWGWIVHPHQRRRRREAALTALCRHHKAVVLSYDDGPGARVTARLLELLDDRQVPATFFVLGRAVESAPELAARLLAEGHEMGSHTFDHTNAWKVAPHLARRDRDRGIETVDRIGGRGGLFRPPYGKLTWAGWRGAEAKGLSLGWWTLDSRDSWQRRPTEDVLADLDAAGGGIVLMHDGDAYERAGPGHGEYVLDLTARLIDHARGQGYGFMRLGELLALEAKAHG